MVNVKAADSFDKIPSFFAMKSMFCDVGKQGIYYACGGFLKILQRLGRAAKSNRVLINLR